MHDIAHSDGISPSRRRRSPFTLIELLIVVAIIAILVAMLMPALSTAVERGRFASCSGNLKQLQNAGMMYVSDFDRYLPEHRQWVANGYNWNVSTAHIETGTIYPYVGSTAIYLCPTFELICGSASPFRSYAMNFNIGYSEGQRLAKLTTLTSPSSMPTFTEENPFVVPGHNNYPINDGSLCSDPFPNSRDNIASYHLTSVYALGEGWASMAYADGHVTRVQTNDPYAIMRQ